MQLLKVAFGYDIGADSHETIEFPLLIQHLVKTVENSELHTLLFGVMFQRRTQIGKIRITQRFVGLLVVQQGYFVRNDDTLGLGAVSQILAARMIARRVSSRTDSVGSPFNRRDTVACENPVRFAISLMVAIAPSPSHGCLIRF